MTHFIQTTLYKIPEGPRKIDPLAYMDKHVKETYTVQASAGLLIKNKIDDLDVVLESFRYNIFHTDFALYAYLGSKDWATDAIVDITPFVSFKRLDCEIIVSNQALHNITSVSDDEESQQFITSIASIKHATGDYVVATTLHSELRLGIEDGKLIRKQGDTSYLNYMLHRQLPFLLDLEFQASKRFEMEEVDLDSLEAQFKTIEHLLLEERSDAKSKVYQTVTALLPGTVISEICVTDELTTLETYEVYVVDEDEVQEDHPDMERSDIMLGLKRDNELIASLDPTDYFEREIAIRTYEDTENPNKLFNKLNGFYFDHDCVTDIADVKHSALEAIREYRKGIKDSTILKLGDAVIDLARLPLWKTLLLIPFVRIQIMNGLDLNDPELEVLDLFVEYVNEQLVIT